MSGAYRGEGKTDAKDARVIADLARLRRDFRPIEPAVELTAQLQLLVGYRRELVALRVRLINQLRDVLVGICPSLEPSAAVAVAASVISRGAPSAVSA